MSLIINPSKTFEENIRISRMPRSMTNPKCVRDVFSITKINKNGIFRLEDDAEDSLYDRCYEISEVNYVNGEKLVLRSEADFDKFVGVRVDGRLIDKANYIAYSGSTIVEISENYMASLSNGQHDFEILSKDGSAKAVVVVNKPENVSDKDTTVSNGAVTEVAADSSEVTNSSKNTNSK